MCSVASRCGCFSRATTRERGVKTRDSIGTAVGTVGQLDGGTARDRPPRDSGRSNAAQAPLASYWARFAPMGGGGAAAGGDGGSDGGGDGSGDDSGGDSDGGDDSDDSDGILSWMWCQ